MAALATAAGVSRQTLYNEFGNRKGLAVAYISRFVDGLLDMVAARLNTTDDLPDALQDALRQVFAIGMHDPVVLQIVGPNPHGELLGIVTVDGTPIVRRATDRLADVLAGEVADLRRSDAVAVAGVLVRLAFSHLTMPLDPPETAAREVASVVTPFIAAAGRIN